jgi:hypothetical protein
MVWREFFHGKFFYRQFILYGMFGLLTVMWFTCCGCPSPLALVLKKPEIIYLPVLLEWWPRLSTDLIRSCHLDQ